MPLNLQIDDILTLKKPHACGANSWRIYRVGADIGIKCTKCDHRVMIPRSKLERRIRLIQRGDESIKPSQHQTR